MSKLPVYDLSVEDVEHYVLENGVVTHNTGIMYSADTVFIIGRQQEKEGKDIIGYNFILNVEKSRYVKEKSKIPLNVTYDGGISPYSGLLDIALDTGFVVKPSNGWYSKSTLDKETGEIVTEEKKWRRKETDSTEFWRDLFRNDDFKKAISEQFKLGEVAPVSNELEDLYG